MTFLDGDLNPGFFNKFPPKIWNSREIRFIKPGVLRTSGLYSGFVKACDELVVGPANKEVSNLGKARFGGLKSCGRCCSQNKEKLCHTLIWRIIFLRFKKKSCIMLWYPPKSKLVYNDPREEKETQNRFKMFLILQLMYES